MESSPSGANNLLIELKSLYSKQAEKELLQTVRDFHTCKQEEGQYISSYVLKMKSYIDQLECLGHPVNLNLGVSLILVGLSKQYDSFMHNYNMHSMGKTVNELHAMLMLHEETLPKKFAAPALHAIRPGKLSQGASTSGIFTIELYSFPSTSWFYDTGYGTHISVQAIGNYHLCLPSRLVIVLNNCHYAPSIARGVILVSCLYEDGFINRFKLNNATSVSKNNIVYFSAIPRDGIYEVEISCSNTNDSSMHVVSNKKAKLNLDSSLLWHCRLGHISKKCIEKLQHDGLLNSFDIESLGKCVSCISRKIERKPYSHQVEKAKDLFGLIHTDVSVPFRIVSRQGANYFITFTNDFSRYGYVYLLKHKHEVLETFEVFQKEVENQLEKTIKSLRFNHGGYPKETMGYYFYNPFENKVFVARNAEFFESNHLDQEASGSLEDLEIIQEEDTNPSLDTSLNHKEDDQELVELPPSAKTIKHKWLFKKKTDMDGAVHTFKSYIIAKGFNQTYGVDYEETFSPVTGIKSIKILIAIATFYEYEIWLMDVKTAFLNGHLSEEVYMTHLEGFVNLKYPTIDRSKRLIGLCQSAYIEKILKRYYMENSKRGTIPMQEKLILSKSDGVSTPAEKRCMSYIPYASTIVLIMYAVRCTRPDVAFAQNITSRFQQNPGELHWTTIKNILKYLTDADDLKSRTRYVFVLNGGVVDWKSTKQSISATSSIDAEYIAAFNASKEVVWICKFISRINVVPTIKEPITMYCDNTGAIAIETDHGVTKGARHFCAKVHYL
uniref:Retrotransposon protein, putative, Ty1-copia subclass n=1 Tax=Tanacetum cinerariifolium TaxID=118510 RepID=A0A6L2MTL0_TANCI|nr:hypothetical protein [Tanacetum cinerariifolium]